MGVQVGTITLKDGKVLPLADYIEAVAEREQHDEVLDVADAEEQRFRRCFKRAVAGAIWEGQVCSNGHVITYDEYRLATENLRRRGAEMNVNDDRIYGTKAFSLFEAFFTNPKQWLSSRRLHELTGVGVSSITTLLRRPVPFLVAEGMLQEREDPAVRGHVWMFVAQCDDPKQEARIWYRRMLEATRGVKHPPKLGSKFVQQRKMVTLPSTETVATALRELKAGGGNGVVSMQIDTNTMEAIVRVPLAALPKVIEALR